MQINCSRSCLYDTRHKQFPWQHLAIQRSVFKNVETQLLYPFLNALRKISRAIFFEHNALTESSLFW